MDTLPKEKPTLVPKSIEPKSKVVIGDKPSISNKRKSFTPIGQIKEKVTLNTREYFQTLARTIESLEDTDAPMDRNMTTEDIQSWCIKQAIRKVHHFKSNTQVKDSSHGETLTFVDLRFY